MRPIRITIEAMNERGETVGETADDLLARIWQHETDHLDGVLILDRMLPVDQRANRRTIQLLESGSTP
jgi:peptide deformylase